MGWIRDASHFTSWFSRVELGLNPNSKSDVSIAYIQMVGS